MPANIIVDAHQDLAWNALTFGRDYTKSALATRQAEQNNSAPSHNGNSLLGLGDYLLGHVAVIFSTLFAGPIRHRMGDWDRLTYADSQQAYRLYSQQLDYYHRLVDDCQQFRLIGGRGDLEQVLDSWEAADLKDRRVGLVPLMEGADAIREPASGEVEGWMERGVRIVGLAWAGTRYAGGTGEPGPLTPEGRQLLGVMADLGLILDLSHASDDSFLEALDLFEGVVIASHANPRAVLKGEVRRPERFLSDEMIQRLAARGGVTGIVPYNHFLKADWTGHDGKNAVTLAYVVAMIDHICQITGNADHVAIGSDFDGGFGVESVPAEIDTIADLSLIGSALKERGYSEADVEKVMSGNWLDVLRRGLPA